MPAVRVWTGSAWQDMAIAGPSAASASVPVDPWHTVGAAGEPAFTGAWVNFDAFSLLQFTKDPAGIVRLRGIVKSGSGAVFTLPVGYRPANTLRFAIPCNAAFGYVDLAATGVVSVSGGSNVWCDLSGIQFATDQTTFPAGFLGAFSSVPIEPWHTVGAVGEPAFGTGWTFFSANYPVQFRKTPDGRVELRGIAKPSSNRGAPSSIFILPAGYLPNVANDAFIPVARDTGTGRITADALTGSVNAQEATTTGQWISLGGVSFATSQATFPVAVSTIPLVSTLPIGPIDGQECYFQNAAMATAGVVWHLRYRSGGGTYKWEVLGGASLTSYVASTQSKTLASAAYVAEDFGTGSPTLVVPLAGHYEITMSSDIYVVSPGTASYEYQILTTTAANVILGTLGIYANSPTAGQVLALGSYSKRLQAGGDSFVALAAGETLKFRHMGNNTSAGMMRSRERSLVLAPIRVG